MKKRIKEQTLPANFTSGQILTDEDINKIILILREGINANKNDIDKMIYSNIEEEFVFHSKEMADEYLINNTPDNGQDAVVFSYIDNQVGIELYKYDIDNNIWMYVTDLSLLTMFKNLDVLDTFKNETLTEIINIKKILNDDVLKVDGSNAMTENLNMSAMKIINVGDGSEPLDAVNKKQLDAGLHSKLDKIWTDVANQTTTFLNDELVINRGSNVYKTTLANLLSHATITELFTVVPELPIAGVPNKIYLVPEVDTIPVYFVDGYIYEDAEVTITITPEIGVVYFVLDGNDFAGKFINWDGNSFTEVNKINKYAEYIWVDDAFERIGTVEINLENYFTKTEINALLGNYVQKVAGKGLSQEDFTSAFRQKLEEIEFFAQKNVQSDWNATEGDAFIKNKPDIDDINERIEDLELAVDNLGETGGTTLDDAIIELGGRTLREFFEEDNPTILDQWEITLPNGVKDEVLSQNYVRNIGKYVLQASDITLQYFDNTRRIRIETVPPGSVPQSTTAIYIVGFEPATDFAGASGDFDNEVYADKYVWTSSVSSRINITVNKDKYIDGDDAKEKLAGTVIYYQLATPVSTLMPSGIIDDSSLDYYYQAYKAGGIANKNEVLEKLIALEKRVDNLVLSDDDINDDDINVKSYVIPELEASRIKNIDFATSNNFTFAVLTDTHDQDVIPHLFNTINTYERNYGNLDCVMHHGDLTNGYEDLITHKLKLLKNIKQLQKIDVPFLIAIGNHDYNNNGGSVYEKLTDKEWHAIALNPFTRRLKMVFDSQNPNSKYYYTDFETKKIRVITLEANNGHGGFPEPQLNWLGNEALDFSEKIDRSEWAVIIQSHMPTRPEVNYYNELVANGDKVENLLKAFVNGTSYTDGGSVNVDFTSQGGMEVIAWLNGHGHCDIMHKPADLYWYYVMTTNGHQIERTSTPASPYATIPEKEVGTINEFAFDIFNVDRENRKVKITRIGAGEDREFDY